MPDKPAFRRPPPLGLAGTMKHKSIIVSNILFANTPALEPYTDLTTECCPGASKILQRVFILHTFY